jgi:hypothetical protein
LRSRSPPAKVCTSHVHVIIWNILIQANKQIRDSKLLQTKNFTGRTKVLDTHLLQWINKLSDTNHSHWHFFVCAASKDVQVARKQGQRTICHSCSWSGENRMASFTHFYCVLGHVFAIQ